MNTVCGKTTRKLLRGAICVKITIGSIRRVGKAVSFDSSSVYIFPCYAGAKETGIEKQEETKLFDEFNNTILHIWTLKVRWHSPK
jgi:hypothetical protein